PWFSLQVLHTFHRSDFAPAPGVDAVFVRLHKRGPPLVARSDERLYRDFVTVAFSGWRPTIAGALAATLGRAAADQLLSHAAVDRHLSPSHLELGVWLALFRGFRSAPVVIRQRVAGAEAHARRQRAPFRALREAIARSGLIQPARGIVAQEDDPAAHAGADPSTRIAEHDGRAAGHVFEREPAEIPAEHDLRARETDGGPRIG